MQATRCGTIASAVIRPGFSIGSVAFLAATLGALVISPLAGLAQEPEAIVSKDAISVHRVERGTMMLRESAAGAITSLVPPRAIVRLTPEQSAAVRVGQTCSVQVVSPTVLHGSVAAVRRDTLRGDGTAELELMGPMAAGIALNDHIGALIDVGAAESIVYLERPASARPATTSTIFVLEPDGAHAKRVTVVYGRLSGSQLEIIKGLVPGDRVIVTALPEVGNRDRITLK